MKHVKVVSIGVLTTITLAFLIYVAQYSSYDFPVWSFSEADQLEDVCEKPVHRDWSAGNETLGVITAPFRTPQSASRNEIGLKNKKSFVDIL